MASSRTAAKRGRPRARVTSAQKRAPKRSLDALIGLRVSSAQRQAMEWKAKKLGFESAQDWIRDRMAPDIEAAMREMRDAEDAEALAAAS